jgi:hypothetical protein
MGSWSVVSVTGRHSELNAPFGHNFYVTFRLKYSATTFGPFVEPPILAWDEVIMFNNYGSGERWEFVGNMYEHKPGSPTVAVWGQRYFRAYLNAQNTPFTGNIKGHSKLFDKNGAPVPGSKLGSHGGPADTGRRAEQNKAVQDYLKRNGGILEVEVHDVPGISVEGGKARDIERVLIFNCGVTGMGTRLKAWQHLRIDSGQPQANWTRRFQMDNSNPPGLRTTGLKLVQDYAQVPNTTPAEGAIHET